MWLYVRHSLEVGNFCSKNIGINLILENLERMITMITMIGGNTLLFKEFELIRELIFYQLSQHTK